MDHKTQTYKKEIATFLAICFSATYLLNAYVFINEGTYQPTSEIWRLALTFSMLIPAVSAIVCLLIFQRKDFNKPVSFFFIIFAAIILVPILVRGLVPGQFYQIIQTMLVVTGTLSLLVMNLNKEWRKKIQPFGLAFNNQFTFAGLFLIFYIFLLAASFALNVASGLSQVSPTMSLMELVSQSLLSLVMVITIGWVVYFGEEYGWRFYLQQRLIRLLGVNRGILLLGVIWGLWHAPVITMGYNYPGEPIMGVISMTLFTMVVSVFFGYAVIRTGSVWPAVVLHAANNSIAPLLVMYFGDTTSRVFAFGIGIFGVIFMALFAFWILMKHNLDPESSTPDFY